MLGMGCVRQHLRRRRRRQPFTQCCNNTRLNNVHWLPEFLNKCLMWLRSLNPNVRKVQNRKSLHLIRNNCWGAIDMFSIWVKIRYGILPSFSLLDPQIGGTQHTDNHKVRKFWFYMLRLAQNTESPVLEEHRAHRGTHTSVSKSPWPWQLAKIISFVGSDFSLF